MRTKSILTAAALLGIGGTAIAHPKLVSASPSANAIVATASHIDLHFSEKLIPAFSKAEVTMAAMPGMGAMRMAGSATLAKDGKTLVVTPKARLPKGKYIVAWHVVSTDTHKVAGNYAFTVK